MDLKALQKEIYFDTKIELLLLPIFHIISNATFNFYIIISSKKKNHWK